MHADMSAVCGKEIKRMPSIEFHIGKHETEKCIVCREPSSCKFYVNDRYIELCETHMVRAIRENIACMERLRILQDKVRKAEE